MRGKRSRFENPLCKSHIHFGRESFGLKPHIKCTSHINFAYRYGGIFWWEEGFVLHFLFFVVNRRLSIICDKRQSKCTNTLSGSATIFVDSEFCFCQLSKLAEQGSDRLECANVDLKADIERWNKNKRTDFRELFAEYSERHITYYQEVGGYPLIHRIRKARVSS